MSRITCIVFKYKTVASAGVNRAAALIWGQFEVAEKYTISKPAIKN